MGILFVQTSKQELSLKIGIRNYYLYLLCLAKLFIHSPASGLAYT